MSVRVKHWQDPANIVLGLWMVVSPWALGYASEGNATSNVVIVGILIAALAAFEVFKVQAWEEWVNFALGVWLAISPWALGFFGVTSAMMNALIVGVLVAALALWALGTDRDIGGWWSHAT